MDLYEESFQLILNAGNAKSKALMAMEEAREYHFEEAKKLIEEAEQDLHLAHKTQTELIKNEASGEISQVNILLVHAQDHFTAAMLTIDHAKEFLNIYKLLNQLLVVGGEVK